MFYSAAAGKSSRDNRKSKYCPIKRRLRPFDYVDNATMAVPPPLEAAISGSNSSSSSISGAVAHDGTRRYNNPAAGGLKSERKQHERSSLTISRILMLARQGESNVVVDMLAMLLNAQSKTSQTAVTLKEFNLLLKELGDNGFLDHCERILSMMLANGVEPSVVTYSTLISRAGTWQKVDMAEAYFHKLITSGIHADLQSHNCLVNAYVKSGQPDKAFEMIGVMDAAKPRIFPNIVTFNTLIDSHARNGDVAKAHSTLDMMKQRGIEPNALTYSSLIHACCQANAMDEAFALIERMETEKLEPTDVTFSVLLHGLGQAGDLPRAFKVLEGMKRKGLRPNIVTMSSLVYACGKHGQLDRAFALYKEMGASADARYQPNSITCSSLIDACLKSGEVDRAFSVVQDMRVRRLPMTQVTYTSLITELTKLRRLDRLFEVLQTGPINADKVMPKEPATAMSTASFSFGGGSYFPTSAKSLSHAVSLDNDRKVEMDDDDDDAVSSAMASYKILLAQRFQNATLTAELSKLLDALQKVTAGLIILDQRCLGADEPPTAAEDLVLSSAIKSARLFEKSEMAEFLQNIMDLPIATSSAVEAMLVQACRHLLQKFGRASRLLKLLKACQVGDDSSSFSWSIYTYSNLEISAREFRSKYRYTIEAYQWMKEKEVTPCARIYNELLRCMNEKSNIDLGIGVGDTALPQRRKQLKNAELFRLYLVFQEMRENAVQVDAATYNTLINACAVAGDLDRAVETVQAMQEAGIHPDVITFTCLIKACSNSASPHRVQLAELYFAEMQQRTNHFAMRVDPTIYTYVQLMKTHLHAIETATGQSEERIKQDAQRIWQLMEDLLLRGLTPNLRLWRMCVVAALMEANIQKALGLLVVIREQLGGAIDYKCWIACADFCRERGHAQEEVMLRKELRELPCPS